MGWDGTAPFRARRVEDAALSPAHERGSLRKPRGGGRAEVRKPFSCPGSLLRSLGCECGGWQQPPWAQRGRGNVLGLCRRVLPALVRPNRRRWRQPCAGDRWCLPVPSARSGTPGPRGKNLLAEPTAAAAPLEQILQQNPSFARNLSVSRDLNIRADEEPRCPLWARAESKKRK